MLSVSYTHLLYKDNWIGKRATEAANSIARERNLVQSKDIGKANRLSLIHIFNLVHMVFDFNTFQPSLGKLDKTIYDTLFVRTEIVFGTCPSVSYTHLDVYKRQHVHI